MKQIAFFLRGDEVAPVEYWTEADNHVFEYDGLEYLVAVDRRIPPLIVTRMGDLVDVDAAPRLVRKYVQRAKDDVDRTHLALRFFMQVGDGVVESHASRLLTDHAAFLQEAVEAAVKRPEQGAPSRRDFGDPRLQRLLEHLEGMGLTMEEATAVVANLVRSQRTGHATAYLRQSLLDRLVPAAEATGMLIAAAILGVIFGIDVSSTSSVDEWWAGNNRGWFLLFLLIPVGYIFWRMQNRG